jgi:hypothetical protein
MKYIEKIAIGYLVFGLLFAMSIGPEMMSSERSIFSYFFNRYDDIELEQTGNLNYINPVAERRLSVDPAMSVTRLH